MKKLAIGAVGVAVLAVAGASVTSYYVGERIEQAIVQAADAWSEGSGITVQIENYQRGIISSKATTLWSIGTDEGTYELTAEHDILHGPWPMGKAAKMVSRFLLPQETDPALLEALGQRAPLEWTALADWSGALDNSMVSPSFNAKFEDGSSLSWGGLQSEWSLSAQHDASKGGVRMPTLLVEEQDGSRIDVAGIDMTFDASIPEGYSFWIGSSALAVERLMGRDATDGQDLSLQGIALHSNNVLEKDALQSDVSLQVQQLDSASFRTKNIQLQAQVLNINAAWYEQWMAVVQAADGPAEQTVQQLVQSLPQLLAGKPELRIQRLSMDSSDGAAELSASLRYVGEQPEAFDPSMDLAGQVELSMPVNLVKLLLRESVRSDYVDLLEQLGSEINEAELQAEVDAGVQERLQMLIDNGVLKERKDAVGASLSFAQGEFKLNDQPQSLMQLLGIGGVF